MKKILKYLPLLLILPFVLCACSSEKKLVKASKELTNYTIVASLNDEEKQIVANQKVDYKNNSDGELSYICFHLYGSAFSEDAKILPYTTLNVTKCFPNGKSFGDLVITNPKVNNADASFSLIGEDNNILKIDFPTPLAAGDRINIEFDFILDLANCTHRLGFYDDIVNLGNWYPIVCVYENDNFVVDPYYPLGDPFYSDCSNYNVQFTFPQKYRLASTGNCLNEEIHDEIVTTEYSAKAVRDFAMVLGSDYKVVEKKVGNTTLNVFCYNDDEKFDQYMSCAENSIKLFNKLFGEYPYKTLSVCFTKFLHGGMEYPNLVMISDTIESDLDIKKVIVHEIAHQWWYGVVGNNEVDNAWIDESLAEYSTLLYFEEYKEEGTTRDQLVEDALTNYLLYEDVLNSLDLNTNSSMQLKINEYSNDYEYVYMVYVKGLIFLEKLRCAIGDAAFFGGLKELYNNNMFANISKTEFIEAFNNSSKVDNSEFIEGWLSGKVLVE